MYVEFQVIVTVSEHLPISHRLVLLLVGGDGYEKWLKRRARRSIAKSLGLPIQSIAVKDGAFAVGPEDELDVDTIDAKSLQAAIDLLYEPINIKMQ